jgi:hypothetical protein
VIFGSFSKAASWGMFLSLDTSFSLKNQKGVKL